jgi:exocyst complex component 4
MILIFFFAVPKVEFEDDAPSTDPARNTSSRRSRLTRFLDDLALRPNESPFDANELSFRSSAFTAILSSVSSNGVSALQDQNPEANSFTYLETVLESLAVLGKLGSALDVVAQRLPSEIYSLIESTLEEVSERVEFNRQEATPGSGVSSQSLGRLDAYATVLFSLSEDAGALSGIGRRTVPGRSKDGFLSASSLRLAALESTAKHADHEVIQDLFWTLYSKLDAVIQGLRVVYEVSNRIGSVRYLFIGL